MLQFNQAHPYKPDVAERVGRQTKSLVGKLTFKMSIAMLEFSGCNTLVKNQYHNW